VSRLDHRLLLWWVVGVVLRASAIARKRVPEPRLDESLTGAPGIARRSKRVTAGPPFTVSRELCSIIHGKPSSSMFKFLPTSRRTAWIVSRSLPWLGHCWPASPHAAASRVSPLHVVGIGRCLATVGSVMDGADPDNIPSGGKQNLTVRLGV
jgi:hypothetical protein